MVLRAVLFDMDGTIFDSGLDWIGLRHAMGLPADGRPILEQLKDAPDAVRTRSLALLHAAEREGAQNGALIPGSRELLETLRKRGILCALVTNNSRASTETVLVRHPLTFDLVLTRDDGVMKPDPTAFHLALARLGVPAAEALAIGDTHLDAAAAHAAGIREIILVRLPEWMRGQLPDDVAFREAANLVEARRMVESLLDAV